MSSRFHAASFLLLVGLLCIGCGGTADVRLVRAQEPVQTPNNVSHEPFTQVLQAHVDEEGRVDYAGLQGRADSLLTPYLQTLAATDPSDLSRDEKLAFWINAYNAYAIKLVLDHYPVASINDIKPSAGPQIPKVNSPFVLDVGEVAGQVRTLDEIEHQIIRERFDEPRIHFALVCAAESCPRLRREAYVGARLDVQLNSQARTFLHNDAKNAVPATEETIKLSRIFKWFDDDFGGSKASTQRFLAPYFEGEVRDRLERAAYRVEYRSYNWALNDQEAAPSTARAQE